MLIISETCFKVEKQLSIYLSVIEKKKKKKIKLEIIYPPAARLFILGVGDEI